VLLPLLLDFGLPFHQFLGLLALRSLLVGLLLLDALCSLARLLGFLLCELRALPFQLVLALLLLRNESFGASTCLLLMLAGRLKLRQVVLLLLPPALFLLPTRGRLALLRFGLLLIHPALLRGELGVDLLAGLGLGLKLRCAPLLLKLQPLFLELALGCRARGVALGRPLSIALLSSLILLRNLL